MSWAKQVNRCLKEASRGWKHTEDKGDSVFKKMNYNAFLESDHCDRRLDKTAKIWIILEQPHKVTWSVKIQKLIFPEMHAVVSSQQQSVKFRKLSLRLCQHSTSDHGLVTWAEGLEINLWADGAGSNRTGNHWWRGVWRFMLCSLRFDELQTFFYFTGY